MVGDGDVKKKRRLEFFSWSINNIFFAEEKRICTQFSWAILNTFSVFLYVVYEHWTFPTKKNMMHLHISREKWRPNLSQACKEFLQDPSFCSSTWCIVHQKSQIIYHEIFCETLFWNNPVLELSNFKIESHIY